MPSLINFVYQHIFGVLCEMRTEVGSSCALNNGQCDDVSNVNAVLGFRKRVANVISDNTIFD